MRKRIAAMLLGAALLLGLAGCTPAAGNGDTVSTSVVEESSSRSEENGMSDMANVTDTIDTADTTTTDSAGSEENSDTWHSSDASVSSDDSADLEEMDTPNVPPNEEANDWGVWQSLMNIDCGEADPDYIPLFSEGGTPEDSITTEYDALDLVFNFQSQGILDLDANCGLSANQIDAMYPFECVRKTADDRFYVVYKVRQGGYYYMFFEDVSLYGETPVYMLTNVSYVYKKLSYEEMKDVLVPGTSITAIERIDPSWECYALVPTRDAIYRRVILSDGVLYVGYEKTENGDFIVIDSLFYPDFQMAASERLIHYYNILPSDYPA